jgi:predicted kinase/endonuclease IV
MKCLILTAGLIGSGKSTVAKILSKNFDSVVLSSDKLRGIDENEGLSKTNYQNDEKTECAKEEIYNALFSKAKNFLLEGKKAVIIDASFYKKLLRDKAKNLAKMFGAQYCLIEVVCSEQIREKRLYARFKKTPSTAPHRIYLGQKINFENISEHEKDFTINNSGDASELEEQLAGVLRKLRLKTGYPDNPVSETLKIFPDSFFISAYSSLDKIKPEAVELHFQTFNETAKIAEIKKYVKEARSKGIELVMHMPFMELSGNSFNILLPVKIDSVINSRQADIKDIISSIKLCSDLKIKILTMHASSSMRFMKKEEFEEFRKIISELNIFSKSKGVSLSVETGGLRENELKELIKMGLKITLDSSHLILDLIEQGFSLEKANQKAFEFFKENEKFISILHLNQTSLGKDIHMDISYQGINNINRDLINYLGNSGKFVIFEFKPKGL